MIVQRLISGSQNVIPQLENERPLARNEQRQEKGSDRAEQMRHDEDSFDVILILGVQPTKDVGPEMNGQYYSFVSKESF